MENAALGIAAHIKKKFKDEKRSILIVAGPGNNGADGITVARMLHNTFKVKLYMPLGAKSKMAKLQLKRTQAVGVKQISKVKKTDIIIDALFGAGLNKGLSEELLGLIKRLNAINAYKIACDIPTGINEKGDVAKEVFKANTTFTMGALKTSLYSDNALNYVGKIKLVDLGISRKVYEKSSDTFLLEKDDFNPPLRDKINSHKGNFGHLNVFAGQKQGAALLSALAAMRFGSGLVTVITNEQLDLPPYLMKDFHTLANCNAIAIGMGLGNEYPDSFLQNEVVNKDIPIVLDADSFSCEVLLQVLLQTKREIVITPHPKEFSKLMRYFNKELSVKQIQADRFTVAKEFTLDFPHITLVLKGANSIIAKNGKCYVNPFHSSKLSQGGSGDVLSGLIGALIAQRYSGLDAAINGSLALSFSAQKYKGANFSMHAKDIIDMLKEL